MGGKQRGSKKSSTLKEDSFPEAYAVEKIVDNRIIKGKVQYKVHWEGYNTEDDTWENESQLDCQELLEEYLANEQSTEVSNLRNEDASKNSNSSKKSKKSRGQDKRAASKSEAFTDESEDEAPKSKKSRSQDKRAASKSEAFTDESEDEAPKSKKSRSQDKRAANKSEAFSDESEDEAPKSKTPRGQDKRAANKSEAFSDESEDEAPKSKTPRGQDKRAANKSEAFSDESEDEAPKSKTPRSQDKKATNKSETSPEDEAKESGDDAAEEYEVESILEMHTLRNGNREFLVKWVGYSKSDSTWEPERNLTGTDLLEKFLQKVDKAKELDSKELRINRRPTDRFTSTPQGNLRRQSRRYANKQRVKYYDAE